MKWISVVFFLMAIVIVAGCGQTQVHVEKHQSEHTQQEISTDQAIQESTTMDQTPEQMDSGPTEVHRETIVEKVESEEVVIE